MGRPRNPLSNYNAALNNEIAAVTMVKDMGAQIVDDTFVAGTAAGINIVLNSLRTSNVYSLFYPGVGQSYRHSFYEVTAPTQSAVVFGLHLTGLSGQQLNQNLFGRLAILQRQ